MNIKDIWIINLETHRDRWNLLMYNNSSDDMYWRINRWTATNGKTVTKDSAYLDGVGLIVMMYSNTDTTDNYYTRDVIQNNHGKIGCWLSHKRLLKHLADIEVPENHGHLILEDDVELKADTIKEWDAISKDIPSDWDIVYLSLRNPNLSEPINPPIYRGVSSLTNNSNYGTHAYMVRHGSIKSRILPKLRFMTHEIDVQLNYHFNDLNVYVIYPSIINLNKISAFSSIDKLNKGYILCQVQGGINNMLCELWKCTEYAIQYNRSIILTHWSYFSADLFDIFDFSKYPVPVYSLDKLQRIKYNSVEPSGCEEYVKLFMNKHENTQEIHKLHTQMFAFNKERVYDEMTLLVNDSYSGGLGSVEAFKNIHFTEKFKKFYKEKTSNFPKLYNALNIRHTDMKVDSEALIRNINADKPLFIGTDDCSLKKKILDEYEFTFSTDFDNNDMPLHYSGKEDTLEWAITDLCFMVLSENKISDYYNGIENKSGYTLLIDQLKEFKESIKTKLIL
jgi:glycosyl transferase family 25